MRWFEVENRQMVILKTLEQKGKVTMDVLVGKMGVSSKTVQNDIKAINVAMKQWAVIDCRHGVYKLYITDEGQYRRVRNDIEKQNACFESPQMRMSFIVDTLMNSDQPYLIDELAYAMSIGRTTLMSDIKKLKEILTYYDLSIVGKTNAGISLAGHELNIRLFVLENNFYIIYDEGFLDEDLVTIVKTKTMAWRMDAMTIDYFLRFLTLSLDRLLNGYPIEALPERYNALLKEPCYQVVCTIADAIEANLHITLPTNERLFLTIPFVGMRTPYDISGVENHVVVSGEVLELVDIIFAQIRQETGLRIKIQDEGALEEFIYHLYFMTNRMRYGFKLHNPMVKSMKEKFGVAYRMAELAKTVIEDRFGFKIPEDEVGFLAAYFEIFLNEYKLKNKEAYCVGVICGTGRATAQLVMDQMRRVFDSGVELHILNDDAYLQGNQLDDYDLVISTAGGDFDTEVPLIVLDEIFDEEYLRKTIDRIRHMKKLDIPLIRGVESVMLSLLDEESFMVLDHTKSYEENVHAMMDVMIKQGRVDADFKRRIDEREAKSSMIFDEDVAFPHGYQSVSEHPAIVLGVFPQGLATRENKALRLVFLVALPEGKEDDTVLVRIYDEIITIAGNKKLVEDISKKTSYQALLMYFIRDCDLFG